MHESQGIKHISTPTPFFRSSNDLFDDKTMGRRKKCARYPISTKQLCFTTQILWSLEGSNESKGFAIIGIAHLNFGSCTEEYN
jgi:hypothetical protein